MEWQDRPGKGTMFVNTKKSGESQPDYKGKILIDVKQLTVQPDGCAYLNLSAWTKKTSNGGHLLSMSVDRPFVKSNSAQNYASDPVGLMNKRQDREILAPGAVGDDIPF